MDGVWIANRVYWTFDTARDYASQYTIHSYVFIAVAL
jgi:hypothetical protein